MVWKILNAELRCNLPNWYMIENFVISINLSMLFAIDWVSRQFKIALNLTSEHKKMYIKAAKS